MRFEQLKIVSYNNPYIIGILTDYTYTTVPSAVNNLVVDVIPDDSIILLWDPPTRPNGILTYYDVIVFNELTGFNFSTTIPALDEHEVTSQD